MENSVPVPNIKDLTQVTENFLKLHPILNDLDENTITLWRNKNIDKDDNTDGTLNPNIIIRYILYTVLLGFHTPLEFDVTTNTFDQVVETLLNDLSTGNYWNLLERIGPLIEGRDGSKYEDDFSNIINLLGIKREIYKQDVQTVMLGKIAIRHKNGKKNNHKSRYEEETFRDNTVILNINALIGSDRDNKLQKPGEDFYGEDKKIIYYDNNKKTHIVRKDVNLSKIKDYTYEQYYAALSPDSDTRN